MSGHGYTLIRLSRRSPSFPAAAERMGVWGPSRPPAHRSRLPGAARKPFTADRRFFAASLRSFAPAEGLEGRRGRGGTSAARTRRSTFPRASSRFRAWFRVTWLVTSSRPAASSRWRASVSSRARASSSRPSMAPRSTRSSIFVATLLTFCPPGPEARTARAVMACAGTRTASVIVMASATRSL
jgi:hypothetical protein